MKAGTLIQLSRFTGLGSLVPLEIYAVFRFASNSSFYYLFGATIIIPILVESAMQPYVSYLIDRVPRKRLLAMNNYAVICLLLAYLLFMAFGGRFTLPLYMSLLISIELYMFLAYQAYNALTQDMIDRRHYGSFNGLSEIVGQLPVFAGAIASIFTLTYLTVYNAMLVAIALLSVSSFTLNMLMEESRKSNPEFRARSCYSGSLKYMRRNFKPIFFIFLLNFPFLVIVTGNFLKPIFIATSLHGTGSTLAISESTYAIVAMLSGVMSPMIMSRMGSMRSIYIFNGIFLAGSLLMPIFPVLWLYLAFQTLHGIGNPGIRIVRNTMIMRSVPREEIGRFNGSVNLLTLLGRLLLLVLCVLAVNVFPSGELLAMMGVVVATAICFSGLLLRNDSDLSGSFGTGIRHGDPTERTLA